MENSLAIVMTKIPGVVAVKTRLGQLLSAEQCDELATCFLLDTVAGLNDNFKNIAIAFTPDSGRLVLERIVGNEHKLFAQSDGDLGERLTEVIAEAFQSGFGPVIVVGTDSPTLPPEYLSQALDHLQRHANGVTIGPTDDGGYYLIGVSSPPNGIFDNVEWSTNKVFAQTVSNIERTGDLNLHVLPKWYDIDEPEDLFQLNAELLLSADTAENTRRWLAGNQKIFDLASPAE